MGMRRKFRTICWIPDGRHTFPAGQNLRVYCGEWATFVLTSSKWLRILVFSHEAEKLLDPPRSTLTNLTLVGVEEHILLFATFVFAKKVFNQRKCKTQGGNLLDFLYIQECSFFQKIFGVAWKSLSACRYSCCERYKSWNIDGFFSTDIRQS